MGGKTDKEWRLPTDMEDSVNVAMMDVVIAEKDNIKETKVENHAENEIDNVFDNKGVMYIKTEEAKQAEKDQADKKDETRE